MNTKSKLPRSLATLAVTLSLSIAAFTIGAPDASAQGHRHGGHHQGGHHGHRHHQVQVFVVNTVEVNRYQNFEWRYNRCGHAYRAFYQIITYRDFYSNGTSQTRNVTVWA